MIKNYKSIKEAYDYVSDGIGLCLLWFMVVNFLVWLLSGLAFSYWETLGQCVWFICLFGSFCGGLAYLGDKIDGGKQK